MQRRHFFASAGLGAAALSAAPAAQGPAAAKGRLKQAVCRWCFAKTPIDDLAAACVKTGIEAIDLVEPKEWDAVRKHGLRLTVVPGPTTIAEGLNRKENHDAAEQKFRTMIEDAAKAQAHSIIVFSGNRRGMGDEEGAANCVIGLNRLKKYAEDRGILVVLELLNSKVNHKDYMCDRTPWGARVVREVNSPYVKLLYDIYHMQIMEGDIIRTINEFKDTIGHYHTGGNPGRNEIDETQEIYYPAVARAIAETGYSGYFAHEFIPKRDPLTSLAEAVKICTV
jgi:hydroxypyruvate isomerase